MDWVLLKAEEMQTIKKWWCHDRYDRGLHKQDDTKRKEVVRVIGKSLTWENLWLGMNTVTTNYHSHGQSGSSWRTPEWRGRGSWGRSFVCPHSTPAFCYTALLADPCSWSSSALKRTEQHILWLYCWVQAALWLAIIQSGKETPSPHVFDSKQGCRTMKLDPMFDHGKGKLHRYVWLCWA